MPLLAIESPVNGIASLVQRLDKLPIEVAVVFDNEEPHAFALP
jgi:hypothetical protein